MNWHSCKWILARLLRLEAPFDVKPTDPAVYTSVAILMLSVAAAASYFPSWRAATVDPVVALRDE